MYEAVVKVGVIYLRVAFLSTESERDLCHTIDKVRLTINLDQWVYILCFCFAVTTIYAIEANNVREINFPSESTDHWGRMGDVLTMPAEALRENSDGGLVRLVCFAYNNLEHVRKNLSLKTLISFPFAYNRILSPYLRIFFIHWN